VTDQVSDETTGDEASCGTGRDLTVVRSLFDLVHSNPTTDGAERCADGRRSRFARYGVLAHRCAASHHECDDHCHSRPFHQHALIPPLVSWASDSRVEVAYDQAFYK
jgi:hypothetical protein